MHDNSSSRRSFLKQSAAAGGAFTILRPELVRGAGGEKIKAGLIGCGGRGTAAVVDLLTGDENVELVAMADIFEDKLESSLASLRDPQFLGRHAGIVLQRKRRPEEMSAGALVASIQPRIQVSPDRRFVGFDAYRKLIAAEVDLVLLTTPPGHRPAHFEAAIDAGKHVFTEKPIATDPVGVRRFLVSAEKARARKLSVVSGAQRRSTREFIETVQRIHDGAIGPVTALYVNYVSTPVFHANARDPKWGDMEWQHRNWYSFRWICGDQVVEQHFHNIDFCNWVMGTHPVKVVASGGAAWRPREELYGDIYDHMFSDFVYPNGVRLTSHCRQYPKGAYEVVNDLVVGTKGRSNGVALGPVGGSFIDEAKPPRYLFIGKLNGQVQEHIDLLKSIRGDGPYLNHGPFVAESTLTCIMARESAYSGREITWDMIMASKQDLQPASFDYQQRMPPSQLPMPGEYKFI